MDTSVAIDVLRGHEAAVSVVDEVFANGEALLASEVTRFEVLAGMRAAEVPRTERLFRRIFWIPVDEVIARNAASMAREYRASYSGIDDENYFVAATTMETEARLLTTNVRHFPMLAGLEPAY